MYIYPIDIDWFIAKARINGKLCFGYGSTITEAMQDAFSDYKVIINL